MKLILSRKGFDKAAGGCASPIFEDGSFLSLPIPDNYSRVSFSQLGADGLVGRIVEDLTRTRRKPLKETESVHLDPNLRADFRKRKPGWRPMFGQAAAAQRHLDNHCVDRGDIFLFFGWFRRVEKRDGHFRFKPGEPDMHMLYGWLEVGEVWRLTEDVPSIPDWAAEHPHVTVDMSKKDIAKTYRHNTIYVAAGGPTNYNAGTFRAYSDELVLTEPGKSRSVWRLPKWFHPLSKQESLTYHGNPVRWPPPFEDHCSLQTVGRGQEFVLGSEYTEAESWARALIEENR